jgi:hypothetical protein
MFCFFRLAKRNSVKNSRHTHKNEVEGPPEIKNGTWIDTGRTDENGFFCSASQSKSVEIRLISVIRVLH